MNPATRSDRIGLMLSLVISLLLCGCGASSAGGGGGGNGGNDGSTDPLPGFQLDDGNDELDANVAAIAAADNESTECFNSPVRFTEQDVLMSMKQAYSARPNLAPTFEEYVASVAIIQPAKRDEICESELGEDEALDTAVQGITDAANRLAECKGNDPAATTEDSLLTVKALFFDAGLTTIDLGLVAEETADEKEQQVDADCGAESGD